ncbi:MAG TPA: CDP-diacylglycerol--glycerol-3-phosphate 3-phosphatidyltransferase [Gammaproteobacteria bacterium]|nr:CDP-diacylglycerol--glycerol-3-phosphate 3-phosphatidyltransferase [Gammaproteobacteria bacterium]
MNLPNTLTLLRLFLIPVFVVVFYLPFRGSHAAAALIFFFAAITDWLDGYLARRLKQTSLLGEFLDPVADKIMVAVVLVLLLQQDPTVLLALLTAVIIGREIAVSALREWMAELGARRRVAVSVLGKVKTTLQMLALILMLYRVPVGGIDTYALGLRLLYLAALLTLWSMFVYLVAAWPQLRAGGKNEKTKLKAN